MKEKRLDLLINEFIIILAIAVIIATGFWYFNELAAGKATANEMVGNIEQTCSEVKAPDLDCEIAQKSYDINFEIFCGNDMRTVLDELNGEIQDSNSYWFVQKQITQEPFTLFELRNNLGDKSLGEIYIGINYFSEMYEYKINNMFEHGIFAKPCSVDTEMLQVYAECDVGNAKSLLPGQDSLSNKYIESAEKHLQAGNYIEAITYSTAAVAFQDQIARGAYSELTKTDAPLPVCGQ